LGHLNGEVHRFVPRFNPEVNGWWMCDYGRFLADGLNHREVDVPLRRSEGRTRNVTWHGALETIAGMMRVTSNPLVVASANLSNEALFAIKRNLVDAEGLDVVVPVHRGEVRRIKNAHGHWIVSADAHPNSNGARLMGLPVVDVANLESYLRDGDGPLLVLDAHAHPWLATADAAAAVAQRSTAVLARTATPLVESASVVLPGASWAETEGTYTSSEGIVQHARRALLPTGQSQPAWQVVYTLARHLGHEQERHVSPRVLFAEMAAETAAFAGMTYGRLMSEPGMPIHGEVGRVG
jgi:NADH dehydrogenase/NADH:ubiquinone oxidoreductase subunit G